MEPVEQVSELGGGVTVVSERIEHVRSATIGWFVEVGSANETPEEAGYAHLLEHLLFRGTPSYASEEIDQRFDAMGAEINAGTGKESTSVYTRVLDTHIDEAFAIAAEMVWQPLITDADTEQEREIVLEELAMYEDDPQERVFDLAAESVFGATPLGRPVIGTRPVVGAATGERLRAFHDRFYTGGRLVVAGAGSIDHDALVALTEGALEAAAAAGRIRDAASRPEPVRPAPPDPRSVLLEKQTEQVHLVVGGPALARDDDRRFALRVLDGLLGGTSSSRLFQEIREKRGLAYAVYSFVSFHATTGQAGVYVGTRPDRLQDTAAVLRDELERLCAGGVTRVEVDRAREHVKGRTILAMESTSARMNRLGSSLLAGLPLLTMDEVVERLDAVSADDVAALARELYAPSGLSAAAIGPDRGAMEAATARFG